MVGNIRDLNKEIETMTFIVKRSGERDLKFEGSILAYVESDDEKSSSRFSREFGTWDEYTLYRTSSGITGQWAAKCQSEAQANGGPIFGLIPARTDTAWWHEYVARAQRLSHACLSINKFVL